MSGNVYDELKERGFVAQVSDEDAVRKMLGAESVTFYVGFDSTATSLHAGSLVPIMAMVHLRRAGHRAIAVVGSGTTMVGDPSGKTEMRQMLDEATIRAQGQAILIQLARYLHFDGTSAIAVDNADWLLPLNYIAFLRDIGRHFSVNRMLAAEAYKLRLEKGLSFIEFNYQLLQAYDFLTLFRKYRCTLQMGGDDQWGNILAGVDLIRRVEGGTAEALTFPLLTTASGAKMGKTAQGAVWLDARALQPLRFLPVLGQLRRPGRRPLPPDLHPAAARRDPAPRSAQGQRHQRGQARSWPSKRRRSPTASSRPRRPGRPRPPLSEEDGRRFAGRRRDILPGDVTVLPTTAVPAVAARGRHQPGRALHRGRPDALAPRSQADDRAGRPLRQRRAHRLRRAPPDRQGPRPGRRHAPQGRQEEGPPRRPGRLSPARHDAVCVPGPDLWFTIGMFSRDPRRIE